jgi:small subunit ribosomal protein S3
VDYALSEALTVYGKIGVKVWIFKEEVFGKRDLSINMGMGEPKQQRDKRGGHDRRRIKK